ncbi:translation initiation factor eIF2B subunit delta [Tribolium castaneum]|uniref:Translation initiation factor eIF2B subunit delta n=1 Tax=Tribolium castaneum TaxID=7070 RepID=D2A0K3_TRICA|nr:PREDICTED: translation initiation factor eIF-2B subunit delta [Tribolium castaneum]EFA02518.1 Translation initiation factor eIF-2B subunit delta-like Protein [Tribolium castaneum]|eukprot:XP_975655.1 PREDICTED: translation initiation factor eIF-2B subunit delta [Tribolium castaneum]
MDKGKQTNAPSKGGKVDGDGLTKKERRALKVQEKNKQHPPDNKKDSQNAPAMKTEPAKPANVPPGQLSEKELRRLEWEKKLAEQKPKPEKSENDNISKAELKARRREQQEAQRLAKQQQQKPPEKAAEVKKAAPSPKKVEKKKVSDSRRLQIVSHLYSDASFSNASVYKNVHPAFVRLGVQYSTKKILGSNARARALLAAVKCLINDLQTPPKQEFCRYLETVLQTCMDYLQLCRPLAVSMTNALRHFKTKLHQVECLEDNVKKEKLLEEIETYVAEEIDKAGEAISLKVNEKISNGDVILTYGCSSLVTKILKDAHLAGKQFKVVVIDGRPLLEGRTMLQRLVQIGINCTYVQMNAVSYVMNQATKLLLGAHALLTNGYVMSRIGTAQVALVAQAFSKPVLVCCETYKFSEQVLTDSFVYNELGDPEMLFTANTLDESSPLVTSKNDNLQILNLLYDVTPPDLITAVVTELAILPCTSAPVVLRIKP